MEKKSWNNPKLKNLSLDATKEGAEPYYFDPRYPECNDPANTGDGYQVCKYHDRPCKYYGIFAGGKLFECNAPSNSGQSS